MAGIVYILAFQYTPQIKYLQQLTGFSPSTIEAAEATEARNLNFMKQRNEISRQLNLLKQSYGQQSCEMLKILQSAGKTVDSRVSQNGGWCADTSSATSENHKWDKGFSTALSLFLQGKTVASFGDGPGEYKKHLDSLKQVTIYAAFDGAPFCENVTQGLVKFLDLTAPQYGLQPYDWVVSVEVGEHIPAAFEEVYMDNIARHAREGIVLSWAVPGQGGLSHVNNKALEDVIAQLYKRNFTIDKKAGEPLRQASSFAWLKGNVHVYRRINPQSFVEDDV